MRIRVLRQTLLLLLMAGSSVAWGGNTKNHIYLVPTLHGLHQEITNYSYDDLGQLLTELNPDVLLVELTDRDLLSRKEQTVKTEYQKVVFPFADEYDIPLVAMEPDEPDYSRIINKYARNMQYVDSVNHDGVQTFERFLELFYQRFSNTYILSPKDLTGRFFNELSRLKREFQFEVFGEQEREVWEEWNSRFLSKISEVNSELSGKKIVVLAGFEHYYWLAEALSEREGIQLTALR